ncbi:MAG TPA: HAMP domain-containing sensor histidine kinase [Actinomycetota bacterium]|nr:HAMP domain-containing sensor histidine kinase [Actinomycetota bacterium]
MSGRLRAYVAVVVAIGFTVLAALATTVDIDRLRANGGLVAHLGFFLVAAQFFSVPLSRDRRGPRVLVNAPFAFALVLYGGVGFAVLLQAATIALSGVVRRSPARKIAFNVGDHTIGLAAGAGVWVVLSGGQAASTATLPAVLAGTFVFIAVKTLLFGIKVHLDTTMPADLTSTRLFGMVVAITGGAMAVVLTVVLVADNTMMLFLALAVPTIGLYVVLRSESGANIRQGEAEQTAHREAELRAQEQQLLLQQQELTRKLQEADKIKDDLLAMVSHELRNPLTTVLGVFRLFTVGAPLTAAERQEMLEMGERQATRLRNLIEQLLLAARFERGDAGYPSSGAEPTDADAAELALQAAGEARAGHRDHPIRVECDGSLPVRVAPDAVLQILGSLLDNACKYSSNQRLVRLLAERDGEFAVLAVEDEGAGIPLAEREHVFERFTRLDKNHTGLGLGLFIGRQLARAQGGDLVLADPRHSAGSRFELRLPLRQHAAAAPPPASSEGSVAHAAG